MKASFIFNVFYKMKIGFDVERDLKVQYNVFGVFFSLGVMLLMYQGVCSQVDLCFLIDDIYSPLLLFLAINVRHQIVECQVKTRPDVYEVAVQREINHMVDLLNRRKFHWMFHLRLKHRHPSWIPEMCETEKTKIGFSVTFYSKSSVRDITSGCF